MAPSHGAVATADRGNADTFVDWYWVPDPELLYVPAKLENTTGASASFRTNDGEVLHHPTEKIEELPRVYAKQLQGLNNLCTLDIVSEPSMLHIVRSRYEQEQIYTGLANAVIVVNPFREIASLYSQETLDVYLSAKESKDVEPHSFTVALDALNGLKEKKKGKLQNQVILISGESGAGKTESTKHVLHFFTKATAAETSKSTGIEDLTMNSIPILEAFGNAMTVRNNNSSRFGKWMQMLMNPGAKGISGCSQTSYTLELTRICHQSKGERNFHAFFQLMAVREDDDMKFLELGPPEAYRYLRDSLQKAPGIDDARNFKCMKEALGLLNFSPEVQLEIFKIVVGILNLGNIEFITDDSAGEGARLLAASDSTTEANKDMALQATGRVAALFGVEEDLLTNTILTKYVVTGRDTLEVRRKEDEARSVRDSLARIVYHELFVWIIKSINSKLGVNAVKDTDQFFGVLDIAGFECFAHNSLEQLFINLNNEFLQRIFNTSFIESELESLKSEGIEITDTLTRTLDNSTTIDLIEGKGGLLSMLDDESRLPRTTDTTFCNKILKAYGKHERFIDPRTGAKGRFGIKHFAGDVMYEVEGFLTKNLNKASNEVSSLLMASSLSVLRDIGEKIGGEMPPGSSNPAPRGEGGTLGVPQAAVGLSSPRGGMAVSPRGSKKAQTLGSQLKASLLELMAELKRAEVHFIRCIKPNAEKVPNKFVSGLVMEQLRYTGIIEAVRIRQTNFPIRMLFQEFMDHYRLLIPRKAQTKYCGSDATLSDEDPQAKVASFVESALANMDESIKHDAGDLVIGNSKVFLRMPMADALRKQLDIVLTRIRETKDAARAKLEEATSKGDIDGLKAAITEGENADLDEKVLAPARDRLAAEERKVAARSGLAEAVKTGDIDTIERALAEGVDAGLTDPELAAARGAVLARRQELAREAVQDAAGAIQEALSKESAAALSKALETAEAVGINSEYVCKHAARVLEDSQGALAAVDALEKAMGSRDIEELRAAIAQGEKARVKTGEVDAAKALLAEEERRANARAALSALVQGGGAIPGIESAIAEGEAAGLQASELAAAVDLLGREKRKAAARASLAQVDPHDADSLSAAIEEGEAAGLQATELERAKALLDKEEHRLAAQQELQKAMQERDIASLRSSIMKNKRFSVTAVFLPDAVEVLATEERRATARASLCAAIAARDQSALAGAIQEGIDAGLGDEDVKDAKRVLTEEQRLANAKSLLAEAVSGRQLADLKAAIKEGEAVGLQITELAAAKAVLTEETHKAAVQLELVEASQVALKAIRETDVITLLAAIEKGKNSGLALEELARARKVVELAEKRVSAYGELEEAIANPVIGMLHAAITRAENLGVDVPQLHTAKELLKAENRKANARVQLSARVKGRDMDALQAAIDEAVAAGVEGEEVELAKRAIEEERARAAARAELAGAMSSCGEDAEVLRAAIAKCEAAGIPTIEFDHATAALAVLQRKAQARDGLENAVRVRAMDLLQQALAEGEAAGLQECELQRGKNVLKEVGKKAARASLQHATQNCKTTHRLFEAIAEAEAMEVDEGDICAAKIALLNEDRRAALESERLHAQLKDDLMCRGGTLAFEVHCKRYLRAHGVGGFDWKIRELSVASAVLEGRVAMCQQLSEYIEKMWFEKKINVLDELRDNLHSCTLREDGQPGSLATVPLGLLARACSELRSSCGRETTLEQFRDQPLGLLCARLYTQQDVDIDRFCHFPDCPMIPPAASSLAQREAAYQPYRDKVKYLGSKRNPMLFGRVDQASVAALEALKNENGNSDDREILATLARDSVKLMCLLSAMRTQFDAPRTVTRAFHRLPKHIVESFKGMEPGHAMFWPTLLSTTTDPTVIDRYRADFNSTSSSVIFEIANVTEGLEMHHVSQYPEEWELLLPMCSVLIVDRVHKAALRPVVVHCQFEKTLMSKRLQMACLADLRKATHALNKVYDECSQTKKLSGDKKGNAAQKHPVQTPFSPAPQVTEHIYRKQEIVHMYTHFQTLDRRGVFAISSEDLDWAQLHLAVSAEYQRLFRKGTLQQHFRDHSHDITPHRFFSLAMPAATEQDMSHVLHYAAKQVRQQKD